MMGYRIKNEDTSEEIAVGPVAQFNATTGAWQVDVTFDSASATPPGDYSISVECYGQTYGVLYPAKSFQLEDVPDLKYVAMGDSFSSGEGVEPFEDGTDTETDKCHRSTQAYPRLLEQDPDLSLDLGSDGFVACSGATTAAITLDGFNGEGAQMDKVTSDTDLITMTIGGNNMKFSDFATACVWEVCGEDSDAYSTAMANIANDVIPRVEYMLGTLRDRLTNIGSTATVLIVGYPQMVPETWVYHPDGTTCWWLSESENSAIRTITATLNTAVKNEVVAVGGNFHFVPATDSGSPFTGHELCRDSLDPEPQYFNNPDLYPDAAYNLHPNAMGQEAYRDLIKAYLETAH